MIEYSAQVSALLLSTENHQVFQTRNRSQHMGMNETFDEKNRPKSLKASFDPQLVAYFFST